MVKPRVWLEPGHGGRDPGAVGNGMRESDIVLDVGLRLRDLLLPAFEVGMARTADVNLVNRVSRANAFNPDLVVSIHANAGGGTGVETLIPTASPNNPSRDLQANRRLAEKMSNALASAFGMRVRRANGVMLETETRHPFIGILRETRAIAVLPEIAFIDSPLSNPDIDVLRNRRGEVAEVLADVIYGWFGIPSEEDEDMTKENFSGLMGAYLQSLRLNTVDEMPEWARPTIEKLINFCECHNLPRGVLHGNNEDGTGLDLSLDMARMFVVLDRAGVFK